MTRKTPPTLRVVTGPSHKRKRPPRPPTDLLAAPDFLSAEAKGEWARVAPALCRLGLLTPLDVMPLAAYCDAFGMWISASRALAAEELAGRGTITSPKTGITRPHPLHAIARQARGDMRRYGASFGLTPSSRVGLDIAPGAVNLAAVPPGAGQAGKPDYFG